MTELQDNDNLNMFINKYDNIFKKYKNREEVKENSNKTENNFLYLFESEYCEESIDITYKLGMTVQPINIRLSAYENYSKIRNIECLQCELPGKRERLVKAFLKNKTDIKPVCGQEYFKNCKNIIKFVYIILYYINDIDIEIGYNFYDNKDKRYNILLDYILSIYKEVIKDGNYNFQINTELFKNESEYENIVNNKILILNKNVENDSEIKEEVNTEKFECEYCKKVYTNISNLKHHQKTAKFCLDIQNKLPRIFKCELCNKVFDNNKYLKQHIDHYCKSNKIQKENELLKNEINLLKTEITKLKAKLNEKDSKNELQNELKIKLQCKDDIIKLKDDIITKLEKENYILQKLLLKEN
jgi:hypothetical protein